MRSIPEAFTSTGILPAACVASQKNGTCRLLAMRPISSTGCNTPVSLLAYISAMQIVSLCDRGFQLFRGNAAIGAGIQPAYADACVFKVCAGIQHRPVFGMAGNDVPLVPTSCRQILKARLMDSVAPEVKVICLGAAPISAATASRASFHCLPAPPSHTGDRRRPSCRSDG